MINNRGSNGILKERRITEVERKRSENGISGSIYQFKAEWRTGSATKSTFLKTWHKTGLAGIGNSISTQLIWDLSRFEIVKRYLLDLIRRFIRVRGQFREVIIHGIIW